MTNICHNHLLLLPFVLGSIVGCTNRVIIQEEESIRSATQALSQSDIAVCTGACAEEFGGTPSSRFPVYYATRTVTPPNGGAPETTVSAAFLLKCGANGEDAAKAFGYDPTLTSPSGMDRLTEVYDELATLMDRLGNRAPVAVDCKISPFFQVFRRVDASHSAAAPAYYVQVHRSLIDDAAAKGGQRPPAIYALDCGNPLSILWQNAATTQALNDVLSNLAIPINAGVLREWTETRGLSIPTLSCGTTAKYRIELPVEPPKNTGTVAGPANAGVELYFVRSSFDGVSSTVGAYYLITNGLGYAIDGCGADIGVLKEALGLQSDADVPDLSPTDPKFTASNPNAQPVLRCRDTKTRVFESLNAPKPYRYFSFGASNLSSTVRFTCGRTEAFFLESFANPQSVQVPEESLAFLSGSGEQGRSYDIGCGGGSCVFGKSTLGACTLN